MSIYLISVIIYVYNIENFMNTFVSSSIISLFAEYVLNICLSYLGNEIIETIFIVKYSEMFCLILVLDIILLILFVICI